MLVPLVLEVAVMVAVPPVTAVTLPLASTVATPVLLLDQVALPDEPSERLTVAVRVTVEPAPLSVSLVGLRLMPVA